MMFSDFLYGHKNKFCFESCDSRDYYFILKTPLQSSTGSFILSSGNSIYLQSYVRARLCAVCRCCQLTGPHLQQPSQHRAYQLQPLGDPQTDRGMFPGATVADGGPCAANSWRQKSSPNRRLGGHVCWAKSTLSKMW